MENVHYSLGTAAIVPSGPVQAGSWVTIDYTFRADHPIDDTGYVKVVFRFVGDFGTPQFDHPQEANYCSVRTTGHCKVVPRWDGKGHTRPWDKALYLQITGGFIASGDRITVRFGDTSGGAPGWKMQTFCEETFEFKTFVDPMAAVNFHELPESPTLMIVPGKPAKAVCIAPSLVKVGVPFDWTLKIEDRWGNPVGPSEAFRHPGFPAVGFHRVAATDPKTGLDALSNPLCVVDTLDRPGFWWADFHAQSEETIGSNSIDSYFDFGEKQSRLDILGHQGNDFQVSDAFWDRIRQICDERYRPGAFVTFPGYEWSGNTPFGGDRNVYFLSRAGTIARSSRELLPGGQSAYPDAPDAGELFRNLRGQGHDCFVFAHVGGRYPDLRYHDEALEVAIEIHSAWGTFEWLLADAIQLGYRVGICANSDGHKGRPGAEYPGASRFGSYGGLTCVLSPELTRESVLAAIRSRHFYATTGNRCLIELSVTAGDGTLAMMGDVITRGTKPLPMKARVAGTAPIDRVELYNGLDRLAIYSLGGSRKNSRRIQVLWSGAEVRGRGRMVSWDGRLTMEGDNRISSVVPVNAFNPDQPIRQTSEHEVEWTSVTTGGLAGCVLGVDRPDSGKILVKTLQGEAEVNLRELGEGQMVFDFGGLEKRITVGRMPEIPPPVQCDVTAELTRFRPGDNPLFLKVIQEDGHMAWTSPVYVVE